MGVEEKKKLLEGVVYHRHKLSQFRNKKVVIDSLSVIHRMMRTMINKDINYIDTCGQNINELHIVLSLATNFLRFGITPIFVFDGKIQNTKKFIMKKKNKKYDKIKELISVTDDKDDLKKLKKQCYKPSRRKINWCMDLLTSIGVMVVKDDILEADPICAKLCMDDENVIGVVSNDIDILLMGAKSLLKISNIYSYEIEMLSKFDFIENLNRVFNNKVGCDQYLTQYLTMNNIIEICVLLGNDFVGRLKIDGKYIKFDQVLKLYKDNRYDMREIIKRYVNNNVQKDKMIYSYYNYHLNNFNMDCDDIEIINIRNRILEMNFDTTIGCFDFHEFTRIAKYFMSEFRIKFYNMFFCDMKKFIDKGKYEHCEMKKYPVEVIFDSYTSKKSKLDVFDRWKVL